MAFPPRFLDELRQRLSLAAVVGRRVKLTRRGREYIGLCPFHNEKTPSFAVVEEKGFYHCFGCGAHGDVISFAMQQESLSFPEAVAALAPQAGLEVPRQTPEERRQFERLATVQEAMEAACAFFEARLAEPEGQAARLYLERRGLDAATIRRFRLGFAPDRRDALKRALQPLPEALLIESGLLRRSEGGDSFDYFRGRVIFPIGDRGGRIIAFGGRILGEGQPKYLNSPETPLFEKGRVLYGWAAARAAAAREPSAVVVEGYMDVIALHRAGFTTAVAPLGTALTETQLEELWRLAPEPILCFDGDAAGWRAADRALGRALPLLKPGFSLRIARLPAGEDPDTLTLRHGAEAMRALLDGARPLAEVLWQLETVQPLDTPERRAALEKRLEERVRQIADRSVQEHYRRYFRERVFATFSQGGRGKKPAPAGRGARKGGPRPPSLPALPPAADPALLRRRQQEVLLALLLNHPFMLNEIIEEVASLELPALDLDTLRGELLKAHALYPNLDAATLRLHLHRHGYDRTVDGVLSPQVLNHAGFARADAEAEAVRTGWTHTRTWFQRRLLTREIAEAERDFVTDTSDENLARVLQLGQSLPECDIEEDGAAQGDGR